MASIWEAIPVIGPVAGQLANGVENGITWMGRMTGGAVNIAANGLVGRERKERILTEVPTWLVDNVADHNKLVQSVIKTVRLADISLLAQLVDVFSRRFLDAVLARVGQLGIIRNGIFSNDINAATLGLVWSNADELASFFVDLVECAKCYAPASSLNGATGQNNPHGQDNEFDLSQPMNRHALICQVQRLAKSIIYILKNVATSITFEEIDMSRETTLRSDDYDTGTLLEVRPSGRQRVINATPTGPGQPLAGNQLNETDEEQPDEMEEEQQDEMEEEQQDETEEEEQQDETEEEEQQDETEEEQPRVANEKWLFVNGIATELFWLHLACKKLARQYSREITGVYNRGDGILWDLVECAGERNITGEGNARSQKRLIQRTSSSRGAQEKLKDQLEAALEQAGDGDGSVYKHVVVIAHSQGCLLLRLALEELVVEDAAGTGNTRQTMLKRLCVFTFGNPSVDWKLDLPDDVVIAPLQNSGQSQMDLEFLSSHVLRTEHFANKVDFVAKLGVISEHRRADSGYAPEHVFVNEDPDWIGHLFGTQYSLDSRYYRAEQTNGAIGDPSWLLTCRKKTSIRPARASSS